jgi:hypothetical protein
MHVVTKGKKFSDKDKISVDTFFISLMFVVHMIIYFIWHDALMMQRLEKYDGFFLVVVK